MMCGGTGESKVPDEEVKGICNEAKAELLQKVGKEFEIFEAVSYKTQVVAGTNYFVKVKIGSGGECIHARIFKGLPHTGGNIEVHSVQIDKNEDDALEYF